MEYALDVHVSYSKVAEDLRGPIFCGNPTYIPADQAEACVRFMSAVDVASVKVLGQLIKVSTERVCKENGCKEAIMFIQ